ncbi:MAG: hypothetical protein HYW02_04255 [Deltaproteobacteria bacterium]|nr:hypothetical protein [Deltaproteobacteria bacterium]
MRLSNLLIFGSLAVGLGACQRKLVPLQGRPEEPCEGKECHPSATSIVKDYIRLTQGKARFTPVENEVIEGVLKDAVISRTEFYEDPLGHCETAGMYASSSADGGDISYHLCQSPKVWLLHDFNGPHGITALSLANIAQQIRKATNVPTPDQVIEVRER